jgi:hypothetical protein
MINHISIAVNEPKKVADVLAEIWDGVVYPFPPAPNSFFVLANDGRGTAVEVTPAGTVLMPGEGLPPEDDLDADTSKNEARFISSEIRPRYVATHLNINTKKSIDEIRAIGKREGWRVFVANRDRGLFQLIELWIENQFMLEVMTPQQTARYVEITDPKFLEAAFGNMPIAQPIVNSPAENLSLIG